MAEYSFTTEELYALINKPLKKGFNTDKIYIYEITPNIRFKGLILQQEIEICLETESVQQVSPHKQIFRIWVNVPQIGN